MCLAIQILHESKNKCLYLLFLNFELFVGEFELLKNLLGRNPARDSISVYATPDFFSIEIMNSQHRIAAKALAEPFRRFKIA